MSSIRHFGAEPAPARHSRAGGNPAGKIIHAQRDRWFCPLRGFIETLDSRLRGNDGGETL